MDAVVIRMSNMFDEGEIFDYGDQIDLLSYSHGVAMAINDVRSSDRFANQAIHQDFILTKRLDPTSPLLNQACSQGRIFKEVTIRISIDNGGMTELLAIYTLKNLAVSSVSISAGLADTPVEVVALNYTSIRWEFAGKNGTVSGAWDLSKDAPE